MHLTKALVSVGAALWLSAGTAAAQTEVKLGHVGAPGSLFAQSADLFAQRANAKLGSKAKVVVFGSSQLGSDGELLKKLKLGTVDLALPSTVMTSSRRNSAYSRCRIWCRTAAMPRASPMPSSAQSSARSPTRPATASSVCGRTATARSPITSGRS